MCAGGYISRTADESVLAVMDKPQWGYALFDAGCWGYASVTVSTLAPLVFVRRIRDSAIVQHFANDVWDGAQKEEQAVWHVSVPLFPIVVPVHKTMRFHKTNGSVMMHLEQTERSPVVLKQFAASMHRCAYSLETRQFASCHFLRIPFHHHFCADRFSLCRVHVARTRALTLKFA